jgi:pyruvate/2-oxoglutarate/acetoin dehydrogenase E1 component
MYIEDRWLYEEVSEVPEEIYEVPIGRAAVRRTGSDVSIVATSYMAAQAVTAAKLLERRGVDAEVIDLRSISPWDQESVLGSVRKTGCLVVADAAWKTCGVASEIASSVAEQGFHDLHAPVARVCLPDTPAPASARLEREYYAGAGDIVQAVESVLEQKEKTWATGSRSLIQKRITAD